MPTKKPIIQVVVEETTLEMFKKYSKKEGRSVSNMARRLIEIYVAEQMLKELPDEELTIDI